MDAIQSTFNGISDGNDIENQYQITGGTTNTINGYETVIMVIERDLTEIKKRSGLAMSENNTSLRMTAEFIDGVAGQPVTPVITANSLQAADYRNDTTPPTLSFQYG